MNSLSKTGIVIIIISVIIGGYAIPTSAEKELQRQEQQCIDEWIFTVYDFLPRHDDFPELAIQLYLIDWMERCHDFDFDLTTKEFIDRVKELGYDTQ